MPKHKTGADRRRSPRLEYQIRVKMRGQGPDGKPLEQEVEADHISYHGARILAAAPFQSGGVVVVESLTTQDTCRFRVVWAIEKADLKKWQMGLELASGDPKVWGIDFSAHETKHP